MRSLRVIAPRGWFGRPQVANELRIMRRRVLSDSSPPAYMLVPPGFQAHAISASDTAAPTYADHPGERPGVRTREWDGFLGPPHTHDTKHSVECG